MQQKDIERFWSKVDKSGECWIWTAFRSKGYGMFQLKGKAEGAHRIAYTLAYGPIPEGMFVCHACDNPPCVRPDHLWLGTIQDNNRDRDQKGRADYDGEKNPHAKLTQAQVDDIRYLYETGNYTRQALADTYGISVSTIDNITYYNNWNKGDRPTKQQDHRFGSGYLKRGEKSGKAKFTQAQVNEIRRRHSTGSISQKQLAYEYGVGESTISRIIRGEAYE
jgi:DNA-binding transcriptional regulator YiaG